MSAVLILCKTPLTSFSVAPLLPTDRTFLIISTLLEILNFLSSSVFFSLPSPCPVHCSVICSSFSFSLVPFLCYNSHLLFLSQALISHVAVSRQLQTHVHTNAHAHTYLHVLLHMHRYGSHQGKVKGLPHYPAPVKTFGVFYALVSECRRREMRAGKQGGTMGIAKQDNEED